MAEEYGILTIEGVRGGTVEEICDYLLSIENAYGNLYAFDLFVDRAQQIAFGNERSTISGIERSDNDLLITVETEPAGRRPSYGSRSLRALKPFKNVEGLVLPDDKLRLMSVVIQSPGVWEFLGSLNPLETLRKYLNDRHEHRKDREYREALEREQLALKNEKLRTEVLLDKAMALREVGMPEDQIRYVLSEHITKPLASIDQYQDSYLINGASIRKTDYF